MSATTAIKGLWPGESAKRVRDSYRAMASAGTLALADIAMRAAVFHSHAGYLQKPDPETLLLLEGRRQLAIEILDLAGVDWSHLRRLATEAQQAPPTNEE